ATSTAIPPHRPTNVSSTSTDLSRPVSPPLTSIEPETSSTHLPFPSRFPPLLSLTTYPPG
ncbi:hypothetical protein BGW80DRAFT_1318058, partial [Lactifluus volemus]